MPASIGSSGCASKTAVLKTTAHVACEVEDLEAAPAGREILLEPFTPMEGVRVAFIMDDEAPIEFMQIDSQKYS